jgi:hypothetical protein
MFGTFANHLETNLAYGMEIKMKSMDLIIAETSTFFQAMARCSPRIRKIRESDLSSKEVSNFDNAEFKSFCFYAVLHKSVRLKSDLSAHKGATVKV